MEVSTGEIRAIANYTRTKDGDYREQMNYAISNAIDPGSTFKLASYMTMLDQHKIDTSTIINAEGGRYKFPKGPTITDTEHDNYEMSVKRTLKNHQTWLRQNWLINFTIITHGSISINCTAII